MFRLRNIRNPVTRSHNAKLQKYLTCGNTAQVYEESLGCSVTPEQNI